jgi:ABC-type enterochelin transport system substrate-binding protein
MKMRTYLALPVALLLMACSNEATEPSQSETTQSSVSESAGVISTEVINDETAFLEQIADFDTEHEPFIVAYYESLDAIKEKVSDETNTFVDPELSDRKLKIKLVFKGDDGYYRVILGQ